MLSATILSGLESVANKTGCFNDISTKYLRAVVGVTCCLSMVGSFLIMLSYILIPEIRTRARQILFNLSLMDFVAAGANFAGIAINFSHLDMTHHPALGHLCLAQGCFAMYGTVSSVLWTICIAVYVFIRIMLENQKIAFGSLIGFYVVCYSLPTIITAWFASTGKLGFDHYGGAGWCSVVLHKNNTWLPFNAVFGNDIWVYLTIFLVPVILFSLHFYIKYEVRFTKSVLTQSLRGTVQSVELKLLFIPLFFILLRIWSLVFVVIVAEARQSLNCGSVKFFTYMSGVGDSGQGFANAILYVFCTSKVRRYFLRLLLCRRNRQPGVPNINNTSSLHSEPRKFYGSFSSDAAKGEFSEDFSSSVNLTNKDAKSLLLNS